MVPRAFSGLNRDDSLLSLAKVYRAMAADRKTDLKLAEAAAKTTAVLETLRSRLSREAPPTAPDVPATEVPDELGRQLEQYFAAGSSAAFTDNRRMSTTVSAEARIPDEIRAQVIDGVVDRILRSWGAPNGQIAASIKSEVIARLVEHVLAELLRKSANRAE